MRKLWLATVAMLGLCGGVALGNYAATQGSGTNFGSIVIGGVHFASQLLCDATTANQCAAVSAGGALKVDNSAVTQPVSATQGNAGSNAQAWWAQIGDATNGPVAVKAASTAAVATDKSLTVQLNPLSPGVVTLGQATKANAVPVTFASDQDVCSYATKSSASISIASATTTSLVAVSGSTAVYVCGFTLTIAGSASSADSAQFEYGTGGSCTGTHALTGTMGSGDAAVSTTPTQVSYGGGLATIFGAPASNGICLVSAGTTVNIQGVLTYVQQ